MAASGLPARGGRANGAHWGGPANGADNGASISAGGRERGLKAMLEMTPAQKQAVVAERERKTVIVRSALLEIVEDATHPQRVPAAISLNRMINGEPRERSEITGPGGDPLAGPVIYGPERRGSEDEDGQPTPA